MRGGGSRRGDWGGGAGAGVHAPRANHCLIIGSPYLPLPTDHSAWPFPFPSGGKMFEGAVHHFNGPVLLFPHQMGWGAPSKLHCLGND